MKYAAMFRAMTLVFGIAWYQVFALAQSPKHMHDSTSPDFEKPTVSGPRGAARVRCLRPRQSPGANDSAPSHEQVGRGDSG